MYLSIITCNHGGQRRSYYLEARTMKACRERIIECARALAILNCEKIRVSLLCDEEGYVEATLLQELKDEVKKILRELGKEE